MAEVLQEGLSNEQPAYPAGKKFKCIACGALIKPEKNDLGNPDLDPILQPALKDGGMLRGDVVWSIVCPYSGKSYYHRILLDVASK